MNKTIALAAALIVVTATAGCAAVPVSTPTAPVTVTASSVPEPATPDRAAVASAYQDWTTEFSDLTEKFQASADASDYDGAADVLSEVGSLAVEGLTLPDTGVPGVDKEWDAAMKDLQSAAQIGVPALRNMDAPGIRAAMPYVAKASAHIKAAVAALRVAS